MTVAGHFALTALVIATVTAVLGTGRVTVALVAGTALTWLWVPIVQLLTGLVFVRRARVSTSAALTAYFHTGLLWSCWLLLFALVILLVPRPFAILDYAIATALIPAALTARALARVAREICGLNPHQARIRVFMHQAVTYAILVLYFAWAVALWPRLAPLVRS